MWLQKIFIWFPTVDGWNMHFNAWPHSKSPIWPTITTSIRCSVAPEAAKAMRSLIKVAVAKFFWWVFRETAFLCCKLILAPEMLNDLLSLPKMLQKYELINQNKPFSVCIPFFIASIWCIAAFGQSNVLQVKIYLHSKTSFSFFWVGYADI